MLTSNIIIYQSQGCCNISLNDKEFTYEFILPAATLNSYIFAATFANDHKVQLEDDETSFAQRLPQVPMNIEHIPLFSTFIKIHRQYAQENSSSETKSTGDFVMRKQKRRLTVQAEKWESFVGGKDQAKRIYKAIFPALLRIISENDYPKESSELEWNSRGEKMNWRFVDQALCWGWQNPHAL